MFRAKIRSIVTVSLLIGATVIFVTIQEATPTLAVGNYQNSLIADTALRYVSSWGGDACRDAGKSGMTGGSPGGQDGDGQCRAFVNCIIWMASGSTQWVGGGNGPFAGFQRYGTEISDPNQWVKGDVIQIEGYDSASRWKQHTAIVVSNSGSGNVTVVDSNWNVSGNPEKVSQHTFNIVSWANGAPMKAFRMGSSTGSGSGEASLVNGGFESGLAGWDRINLPSGVNRSTYQDQSRARSGSWFMEANTATQGGSVGQDISTTPQPGSYYALKLWARDPTGSSTPFQVRAALWAIGAGDEVATNTVFVGGQWTPIEVVLRVNKSGHSKIRVEFYMDTGGNRNINFDDVSLAVSTTDPPINTANPVGSLDSVTSPSPGTVTVRGWSFDPSHPTRANQVHIYIGGQAGQAGAVGHDLGDVNLSRTDVAGVFPYAGANHGFEKSLSTTLSGNVTVCAYGINIGQGANAMLPGSCKTVSVAAGQTAPSAPTISSIAQGNRSLTVNFSGPGSNGGSTITNYQYSINGGTSWVTRSPVSTASPIMITGLTYGETYPIRIRAVNAVGAGTASATVSSTPSSAGDFFPLAPTRVVDTRSGLGAVKIGANKTVTVALGSKVPANARAVALNITAVQPTADTFLTVWPAGETLPLSSNLNLRAREMRANAVIVGLGEDRAVSIFNSRGDTDVVVDITGYFISGFEGVTPSRVMDTRSGLGGSVFGPATQRTVKVAGVAGVPANASAVAVNVTATEPSKGTYLTVFPAGASRPLASTLNVAAGQTAANFAVVRVGDGGNITLYSDQGNVHGIIDVFGWFDTNGNLNPMTPQRVLDTRERTCGIRLGKGETRTVNVGRTNSQAVFVNVTAVDASEGTFVTVFPAGSSMPSTSNLNPMNSQAIPNFVLVGTGSGGEISIYNDRGNVEVIVDVLGFFDGPSRSGSRSNC